MNEHTDIKKWLKLDFNADDDQASAPGQDVDDAAARALEAGLYYIACDLRALADIAPEGKAGRILSLSRLVRALADR